MVSRKLNKQETITGMASGFQRSSKGISVG